jgi:hypothetical protein
MKPDSKIHLKGGAIALVGCGILSLALLHFGGNPLAVAIAVGGIAAAASVEGAQWLENRSGDVPTRDVSLEDAAWSAAPAIVAAIIVQIASRAPTWPEWLT